MTAVVNLNSSLNFLTKTLLFLKQEALSRNSHHFQVPPRFCPVPKSRPVFVPFSSRFRPVPKSESPAFQSFLLEVRPDVRRTSTATPLDNPAEIWEHPADIPRTSGGQSGGYPAIIRRKKPWTSDGQSGRHPADLTGRQGFGIWQRDGTWEQWKFQLRRHGDVGPCCMCEGTCSFTRDLEE